MLQSSTQSAATPQDVALLLAVCPLVGVSDLVVSALGMGALVLLAAPLAAAGFLLARRWLTDQTRLAYVLLVLAAVVAAEEVFLRAFFYDLHGALGVFTPMIAANVAIVGALAAAPGPREGAVAAVKISFAIALILLLLGGARELVGRGSLLHDAALMLGPWARGLETKVFRVDMGFLLGMLPPGAFISFGLLLALRNWLVRREV